MTPRRRRFPCLSPSLLILGLAVAWLAGPAAAAPYATPETPAEEPTWSEFAYTYFRVIEGAATLFPVATGDEPVEPEEVVENQPVLAGDRLAVGPGARLELVLSDGTLLRIEGEAELIFDRIARSPDTEDTQTVIRLTTGELQVVTFEDSADEPMTIATPELQIVLRETGVYRISAGGRAGYGTTRVGVREGVAEVVTDHGSMLVRESDEVSVEGAARVAFSALGPEDTLERWGRRLWETAQQAEIGPVDDSLRYSATSLGRHGSWVTVGGERAWRPRVEADWRPYWSGRWVYTPSGYLWVSYEPWGWVPYHYGTWALDPGFGWVWYPGTRFAPAWVYWHWGNSHVAWVPIGYYSRHYARHHHGHFGLRFGHYGFAGGSAHWFRHWLFCDFHAFRGHNVRHHAHSWDRFDHGRHRGHRDFRDHRDHRDRRDVVPRGIVTTDTRGFDRPDGPRRRLATPRGGDLPDVTRFVAREPRLDGDLERRLVTRDPQPRLAGTPLAPGTVAPRRATPRLGSRPIDTPRAATPRPAPRADTPRSETPGPRTPKADGPRRLTVPSPRPTAPSAARPQPDRPEQVRPRTVRPGSIRPEAVRPDSGRPDTVRPRASAPSRPPTPSRPQSVRPENPTSRRVTPHAERPATVRPRPVRPSTVRPNDARPERARPDAEQPSTVRPRSPRADSGQPRAVRPQPQRPRSVRPQSAPRTVRPDRPVPSRPATPHSGVRSQVQPRSSPGARQASPSTRRPAPRATPRSTPRSTPRATPRSSPSRSRSGVSPTTPRGSSKPQARSRSGSSRNRPSASRSPSRGSRGKAGASRGGGRRGSARRGGGG